MRKKLIEQSFRKRSSYKKIIKNLVILVVIITIIIYLKG